MIAGIARAVRVLGLGLGFLLVLELASWGALRVLTWRALNRPDPRAELEQFRGEAWAERYWLENARVAASFEYRSFVGYRRAPFSGEAISIDARGIRTTVHAQCDGASPTVMMFGGSTLWGYGAPDPLTIPSLVAEGLRREERPACVVNYGELGRVSTSETVELMLALKRSERTPDAVVFYDGCNDVLGAWAAGRADVSWQHAFDTRILGIAHRAGMGRFGYLGLSNTEMLAERIAGRLGLRQPPAPPVERIPALARDVASSYLANLDAASALARSRGATPLFFLQPVAAVGAKPLHPAEVDRLEATTAAPASALEELFQRTYEGIREGRRTGFHDLSGVLDGQREPLYFDLCHVTPGANRIVAAAILARVSELLDRRAGAAVDTAETGR